MYTLAGLMITFAGFSALLLALRPLAGASLSLLDRYLAKTVMTHIFVLTAGALVPAVVLLGLQSLTKLLIFGAVLQVLLSMWILPTSTLYLYRYYQRLR